VKNVRAVAVNKNARVVRAVVGVSSRVGATLEEQHAFPAAFGKFACGDRAGESRADDEAVA
jgi:hypothetical protein